MESSALCDNKLNLQHYLWVLTTHGVKEKEKKNFKCGRHGHFKEMEERQ